MSDTNQDQEHIDLETLTDEEVLNLGPDKIQKLMDQETNPVEDAENTENIENTENTENIENTENTENIENTEDNEENPSEEIINKDLENTENTEHVNINNENDGENEEENNSSSEDPSLITKNNAENNSLNDSKLKNNEKSEDRKEESNKDNTLNLKETNAKEIKITKDQDTAVDFYKKVSAPFKADGKDMQIRSPEDVIRLMQMGVNYSRRMEEMKPMRAMDSMLKQHGLNDPTKLSYLIDLQNGNPEAIQKLLKDNKVDPLDIDVTVDGSYQSSDYSSDPKDVTFEDAVNNTMALPGGPEVISDINSNWDDESKLALRDQPEIFNKLLEQKTSGVYEQITTELNYQKTLGFLANVPILQAYHQVGDAMQKAGVFNGSNKEIQSNDLAPINRSEATPIDTGTRKVANTKNEQPNPNLSSNPRNIPSAKNADNENQDFSSLSDEDFLKLGAPS